MMSEIKKDRWGEWETSDGDGFGRGVLSIEDREESNAMGEGEKEGGRWKERPRRGLD